MIGSIKSTQIKPLVKHDYPQPLQATIIMSIILFAGVILSGNTVFASDPAKGKNIYNRCIACHSFAYHRTGPKHCGLFGRKAGTAPGFTYSEAMRNSNVVWNQATLDAFLKAPLQNMPGTIMGYAGVKNDKERADLIAYLKQASRSSMCQ